MGSWRNSDLRRALLPAAAAALLLTAGCDEALPPRDEPQNVASLGVGFNTTRVLMSWNFDTGRKRVLNGTGSFKVELTNLYDDVLQGDAALAGEVEIWLKEKPWARAVVRIGTVDLKNPWVVRNGLVTLLPDSSARFEIPWDHLTDAGRPFYEFAQLTYYRDLNNQGYFEASPLTFGVRARLQVVENLAFIYGPELEIVLSYRINVVTSG